MVKRSKRIRSKRTKRTKRIKRTKRNKKQIKKRTKRIQKGGGGTKTFCTVCPWPAQNYFWVGTDRIGRWWGNGWYRANDKEIPSGEFTGNPLNRDHTNVLASDEITTYNSFDTVPNYTIICPNCEENALTHKGGTSVKLWRFH